MQTSITNEYFFCANRYAKTLTSNKLTFHSLAEIFSNPIVANTKDSMGIFPGHYIAPYRQLQNIDYHSLLILDIDNHEESEKLLHLYKTKNPYLFTYNFIIYSTFSSTLKSLRLRLIVEVDTSYIDSNPSLLIGIEEYPLATQTLEYYLGLKVDPCSHKRNSFVYTPRIKPTSEYIYYTHLTGVPFGLHHIDKELSLKKEPTQNTQDDLYGLDTTLQEQSTYNTEEIPLDVLRAMLRAINPDTDYHTWVKLIASVHHHSNGATWGFELINNWSSEGKKYCGADDLWYKWNSIKDEVAEPVTIGTLIYIANQNSWHQKNLAEILAKFRIEITNTTEKFASEAYAYEFAKRVSKHQFSRIQRSTLVSEITSAASKTMGLSKKIEQAFYKEIDQRCKFGGVINDMTAQERKETTPAWAKDFVIVTGISNEVKFASSRNPFDPEMGPVLLSNDRFNAENIHRKTEPNQDLAHLAREYFDLPHVTTIKFDPHSETIYEDTTGKLCLNSFVRNESFYYAKYETYTPLQKQIIDDLESFTHFFIPNPENRQIFLNFIAYNIFHIGKKVLWSPLIIASEGYGKDMFMRLVELALGKYAKHFLKIDGVKFFDPQWTSLFEHRSFIHVNEVYVAAGKNNSSMGDQERVFNTIKDRITDADSMRISTKYQNDRTIHQVTNYSFTSNARDAIKFPRTERRLFVLWPEQDHDNFLDTKLKMRPTISRIWDYLNAYGIGAYTRNKDEVQKKLIREAFLCYFGNFCAQENLHPEFKPSGEAFRTKEFYEMSSYGNTKLYEILDEILVEDDIAHATPYYVCLAPLMVILYDHVRKYNMHINPLRSDVLRYLNDRGFVDVSEIKYNGEVRKGLRLDITGLFNGVYHGLTKVFINKEFKVDYENKSYLSLKKYIQSLHESWRKSAEFNNELYGKTPNSFSRKLLEEHAEELNFDEPQSSSDSSYDYLH